ncbi:nanoRNase/pAp phosphatase, hydrolyzes c-di-AMP and oligoRNAs [Haladaptatus litoreus]|uniref:NanoRNase/pAp phosphatase, hydrolyzes c-di-AMP and oligoRNAs n=1 Tax=Haladaptatus litoreus TaxID=553468 RepID=A0A1N7E9Y8_9EURY|nr:bifunctional oligoribonuclease/PAP phosphatase NrnA [Haladaptatus litoreus]SIR84927.1 nanoRNase/pAp phosphatase, hydrolyzes c-di-AMP and oligoRNAs [Haladaptatus litoreus]
MSSGTEVTPDSGVGQTENHLDSLLQLLDGTDSLAIVCHDNPDPDSISSALALSAIADSVGVEAVTLYYGGEITHQQNRAMVNVLDVDLHRFTEGCLRTASLVAFVDHAKPGVNNSVPEGTTPDIVIDHHPVSGIDAQYIDHRVDVGATASILTDYLTCLDIELDTRLATALLFGIRRETLAFMRSATPAEYTSARLLHPHADINLLRELTDSLFTHETLDSLGKTIQNRTVRGSYLVTHTGRTDERDTLPQAADYLLNLEGITTTFVFGIIEDTVHLSARTRDPRIHIGDVLTTAFDGFGSAGGHRDMAGGIVPLGVFGELDDDDELVSLLAEALTERFFDCTMG